LQDWDIRTEPGDGEAIRPEKGGDSLSLVPHGRDKSSSSAELREEVLEPRVFALHARQPVGREQTKCGCLPGSVKIRYAFGWMNHCQMPGGEKTDEGTSGAIEGDRDAPKSLGGSSAATRSGNMEREEKWDWTGMTCSREGR